MTNKLKLLIGLLALGLILVGGSTWFLLNPAKELKIGVSPAPGSYLLNSFSESSEVLLKDIRINTEISDKQYEMLWALGAPEVNSGDYILVVSGTIQNEHPTYNKITMHAEGYDKTGKQVAWTLDAGSIMGQIGLHLEKGETGEFTVHLNFSEDIKSVRIFASNYPFTPS
jgi:hypothetical protein